MKQNNKRLLSILLTLCMVLSLFAGTTTTVNAAVGGGDEQLWSDDAVC